MMPTPYELSIWNKWIGTPGASDILDTRFDGTFQTVWIATVGNVRNRRPARARPAELHEQRGDQRRRHGGGLLCRTA